MLKKKTISWLLLFLSATLLILEIVFTIKGVKLEYAGLLLGLGVGFFGVSLANISTGIIDKKHPEMARIKNIAVNDERNKMLHYKTGNSIYKINTYMMCILCVVIAAFKLPIYITLLFPGILLVNGILYIFIFNHYNKSN